MSWARPMTYYIKHYRYLTTILNNLGLISWQLENQIDSAADAEFGGAPEV